MAYDVWKQFSAWLLKSGARMPEVFRGLRQSELPNTRHQSSNYCVIKLDFWDLATHQYEEQNFHFSKFRNQQRCLILHLFQSLTFCLRVMFMCKIFNNRHLEHVIKQNVQTTANFRSCTQFLGSEKMWDQIEFLKILCVNTILEKALELCRVCRNHTVYFVLT